MKQNNYKKNFIKVLFFSLLLILTSPIRAELNVVTTIKPLHSLISNVMQGVGKPSLIIEGTTSPHSFTLKPSHAKLLQNADVIFWIGEDMETFMEKPLESIVKDAEVISFMEIDSINKLKFREENIFDNHDDHADHDDHDEENHDSHEGHAHGEFDTHIWLDPINAKEMIHEIAHVLSNLDPANKNKYNVNAETTILSIDKLINNIDQSINKEAQFVVFHDAYQYFEKRFDLASSGALTLNTDVLPGAKQVLDIQKTIKEKGVNCIFSEPQFNPKIIETIARDTGIKTGVFDPLGSNLESGKNQYFTLIKNLRDNLKNC
tara:strand:- start:149 stop:1105 length:957 start_codon:yes stop_codon:yes gene_type:complete